MIKQESLLTVVIPAFNAEKYLKETIDSILNQKTIFLFEILISDDCSTDGTNEICKGFAAVNSNIKLIKQKTNLGMTKNQHFVITHPKTKYIAYVDSDDYFIDENYLQNQVNFLLLYPNVSCVFSNVESFNENSKEYKITYNESFKPPIIFDLHTYFKQEILITNSAMVFRQEFSQSIPSTFTDFFQYDWLLHIHHGLCGYLGYNDFIGVRYRRHEFNATNIKNAEKKFLDAIQLVYSINKYVPVEYHNYFTHPNYELNRLALFYLFDRKYFKFIIWYIKWLKVTPLKKINYRDQFWLIRQSLLKTKHCT